MEMSEASPTTPPAKTVPPLPENQQQRWIKYGGNVALSIFIVIVLAGLVVYLAQRYSSRLDMTAQRVYSLKPQTLGVIKNVNEPIRIVSLYEYPQGEAGEPEERKLRATARERHDLVSDLLSEYKSKGNNIEVEIVDPVSQP